MNKFITIPFRKTGHFKCIPFFWLTIFILFCTLLLPMQSIGEGEESISLAAQELIKKDSSGDSVKLDSAYVDFEEHIFRLVNFGKKQQAVKELRYVIANLAKVETPKDANKGLSFFDEKHKSILEELSSLEQLLTNDKNAKEIELISTAGTLKRNVQLAVSPETSKSYYSSSQFYSAFASEESHPVMGVGCGEVYRYLENGDLNYMGKLPVMISLPKGQNRIRIYFDLLHYDIDLNFTDDSVSITSFSYEKRKYCATYLGGVESQLQQLSKIMSDKSWTYKDNTTTVYIPYIGGVVDDCMHNLGYGSRRYYRIRLSSEPSGAQVIIDGKKYGETSLEVLIRRNFGKFRLAFNKDGYFDAVCEYQASENNLSFNAILKPVKQRKK